MSATKPDGSYFTDREIVDQTNTFIGAGHDTTGASTVRPASAPR